MPASTVGSERASSRVRNLVAPVVTTWTLLGLYLGLALLRSPASQNCASDGVDRLAHWDGGWYSQIARNGYTHLSGEQQPSAFFPLLPLLSRAAHTVAPALSIEAWGIVINLLAISAAMVLVDRILASWPTWQRVGCILLLLMLPGAFFYVTFYSEALFVLGVAIVAWALQRPDRLWIAAIGVVIASLDRSIGIVLVVPVAIAALRSRDRRQALSMVAASCSGVALFVVWIVFAGKVELFRESRLGWRGLGGLSYPMYLLTHGFAQTGGLVRDAALGRTVTSDPATGRSLAWGLGLLMDVVLVAALLALRWVRRAERFLVPFALVLGVATLLAGPAISQMRFTFVLVPVWVGVIGVVRHHRIAWAVLALAALAGVAANSHLMIEFADCRWAG